VIAGTAIEGQVGICLHRGEINVNNEALSGLKVIEYSEFISGPYCGKLLADLGAEVIKVEPPGSGDKARSWGPFPQDIPHPEKSGLFLYLNTNKSGVTLNLRSATGRGIFGELVRKADIIVENYPPQETKALGLDYQNLHKINPAVVVISITPFGQTGPYRNYKSCDLISNHMSGEAYTNPESGVADIERQPPLNPPSHASDYYAGLIGAINTMSAIIMRQVTGLGQHVDLSQQETMAYILCHQFDNYLDDGVSFYRETSKKSFLTSEYACKNGYIMISTFTDAFWASLVDMMGNPDWAKSEACRSAGSRRNHLGMIKPKVKEWMMEHTIEEINQLAEANRAACVPIQSVKEAVNSELLAARDFFVEVDHKEAGKVKFPGAPYKLSETPWKIKHPAPMMGEHNDEVYCKMLGYSKDDLVKMKQTGVI
jgi:crotonobetainyl-CoA:carnitine CoA-transferase CaiB-like acyl-CoA transferase